MSEDLEINFTILFKFIFQDDQFCAFYLLAMFFFFFNVSICVSLSVRGPGQRLCAVARRGEGLVQSVSLHALGSRCQQHGLHKRPGMDHVPGIPLSVDVSVEHIY